MSDTQIYHPTLGRSAKGGATDTCSTCGGTIPEDDVPLIVWSEDGSLMWVYCTKCAEPMFMRMRAPRQENGCGNG